MLSRHPLWLWHYIFFFGGDGGFHCITGVVLDVHPTTILVCAIRASHFFVDAKDMQHGFYAGSK